jgi:hypothetical protein
MWWLILYLIVGVIIGVLIMSIFQWVNRKPIGNLRVDRSDEYDGPYMFLELNVPIEEIMVKNTVVMNVVVKDFIPRE